MNVLNGGMLLGLATIVAPLLIHLFARRSPPVMDWGAMQFLPSGQRTQRTIMLHDAWLLMLRIVVVSLLVIALARPWVSGAWWPAAGSGPPRDVAIMLDGSASTARLRDGRSVQSHLHAEARQLLGNLPRGSTVQLYDARDGVAPLFRHRTTVGANAFSALDDIAPPTGSLHLPQAISASVRELWEGQHPHREILVLTDGQRWPWRVDESAEWTAAASLLRQSAVVPRVSVIVREPDQHDINDVGWNSASLSRERCAPGQSTVITGVLRNHSTQAQQRRVWCEINGRPSADHQREVRLLPEATAAITFDVTLPNTGRHSLRLCTEADAITGNDRVDFVAEVVAGVKVLLVDGTPSADPLRSEIFFARAALESHGGGNWIEASTVDWSLVPPETLSDFAAIVLANVPELNAEWVAKLQPFVNRGGAVIISLGDQAAEAFLPIEQQRWLPIESVAPSATASATHVDEASLTLPWWQRFRADHGGELGTVEFRRWWTVKLGPHSESEGPQTWARFKNGDPLLLAFRRGLGTVVIAMSPLDADGNSLPAKPDYVAWLHELLLAVSAPAQRRNIAAGELIPIPPALRRHQLTIIGPWGPLHRGTDPAAIMTRWPGIYVLGTEDLLKDPNGDPALLCGSATVEAFAAQTDPRESDLTTLTAADRAALTAAFPLQFVDDVTNWERQSAAEAPRQELASGLLWCVLIGLIAESLITCRRCQREKSAGSVN